MPTTRAKVFGNAAAEYDRVRFAPIPAALDWLLPGPTTTAVDLAAGSGLVTRSLAGRAERVVAVEPDARMLGHLVASIGPGPDARTPSRAAATVVGAVQGVAEAIPLATGCADAVLASSAWHWFDAAAATEEIARVLRPGGTLGLLWSRADPAVEWVATVRALGRATSDGSARLARRGFAVELDDDAPFGVPQRRTFSSTRTMSRDDVAAMVVSYSGVLSLPSPEREEVRRAARAYLDDVLPDAGDPLAVPVETVCWTVRRA